MRGHVMTHDELRRMKVLSGMQQQYHKSFEYI